MSTRTTLTVLRSGPLATVQDGGRPGFAAVGLGRAGACDRGSWQLGNRLVGNRPGCAGIEATFGGLWLRADRPAVVALTGAPCPATIDDRPVGTEQPVHLPAGSTLRLGAPADGVRTYVAVRGGIDVPPELGSRSTDLRAGVGPEPLTEGHRLPVGEDIAGDPVAADAGAWRSAARLRLRIRLGPRSDWFTREAVQLLLTRTWEVSPAADRVAVRLAGPTLGRAGTGELPSEGCVPGAIQVPADGQPIVFLSDHPVTGGYPVIAVVAGADVDRLAQARPGSLLWFSR